MDRSTNPHDAAIQDLDELGLSTYAARTLVGLLALGSGSARDVSEVVDVPRTRVYDAAQELHERGLVDIKEGRPRTFWPVSPETAVRTFERRFQDRANALRDALEAVGPDEDRAEQRGVWSVTGQDAVTERVRSFLRNAREEIVYMTVVELLDEVVLDELADAAERGVTVRVAGLSPDVEERVRERVPGAEGFESLWTRSDPPAGRLLLVDREHTLVSVNLDETGDDAGGAVDRSVLQHVDDQRSETAVWGSGRTNSLVLVLEAIFTWQLEDEGWTENEEGTREDESERGSER